jgi:hypothetical protein
MPIKENHLKHTAPLCHLAAKLRITTLFLKNRWAATDKLGGLIFPENNFQELIKL